MDVDVDAERLDDEKNRTVNKLIDLCLSLIHISEPTRPY